MCGVPSQALVGGVGECRRDVERAANTVNTVGSDRVYQLVRYQAGTKDTRMPYELQPH